MNRISFAGLLYLATCAPAFAAYTPLYVGVQADNNALTALLGYQINKTYAIEAHYTKSESHIAQSGMTSDTYTVNTGLAALAMIPMKLSGGSPYLFFAKAGYVRITKEESYYIPASVTLNPLNLSYSGTETNTENRVIFGGGVQYDFYEHLSGRAGIDAVGDKRYVYLGAIFKF